jgi:hypothetical protein
MKTLVTMAAVALLALTGYSQQETPTAPTLPINVDWTATNWVVIPFFGVQLQRTGGGYAENQNQVGGGVAALYSVTPNLWTGVRVQSFGHETATGSVQAQLQATVPVFGMQVTPFAEATAGLGSTTLYANAGAGAVVTFHTWSLGKDAALGVGLVGDYEHYVYGNDHNGNQWNLGPMLHIRF